MVIKSHMRYIRYFLSKFIRLFLEISIDIWYNKEVEKESYCIIERTNVKKRRRKYRMKISKIITAVVLFLIISFGLLYGVPKIIPMELSIAYSQAASSTLIYGLAITVSISYVVLSYRKSYAKTEIPEKKYEFYYETFNEEQRQILDEMPEEDKYRFVSEYEKVISDEKKRVLQDKVFDWEHGFVPKSLKPLRVMAMLLLVGSIAYTSLGVWKVMEEPVMAYMIDTPVADQTYYNEGLPPIVVNGNGEIKQRDVQSLQSLTQRLPTVIKNNISSIIFCSVTNYKNTVLSYFNDNNPNYTVFWDGNSVIVNNMYDVEDFYSAVIHIFMTNNDIVNNSTYQNLFQKYHNSQKLNVLDKYNYKWAKAQRQSPESFLKFVCVQYLMKEDYFTINNKEIDEYLNILFNQ